MADDDLNEKYLAYNSEEDNAALNDRYDNLAEEDVESSDEEYLPSEPEEEEEPTESEDEEEKKGEDAKVKKLLDPDFDPYESWDKLSGLEQKNLNIEKLLMADPDVQAMLEKIEENRHETEEDESESEEEDEDDDEPPPRRSDDEYDDKLPANIDDILSTGDESDEVEPASTEPPTPSLPDPEDGKTRNDDDDDDDDDEEDEESDFSLEDINTDAEREEEESVKADSKMENPEEEEEEDEDEEEQSDGEPEKEDEEKQNNEEQEPEEKPKRYRKIPKDSDDSDPTEWETITEEETEEEAENTVVEEVVKSEPEEVKPPTPDPYGYTELHTNIEYIEEYDDDFFDKLFKRYKSSATSSMDESDPETGRMKNEGDIEKYSIEKQKEKQFSVVIANKNGVQVATRRNDQRRKIKAIKKEQNKNVENDDKVNNNNQNTDNVKGRTEEFDYTVNLDVYNHDNYPVYNKENNTVNKKGKSKSQKKQIRKKGPKVRKLKKKKILEDSYNRLHPWYCKVPKNIVNDYPHSNIPSYRHIAKAREIKEKTIEITLEKILNQTYIAIDVIEKRRLRKEAQHHSQYLILELADNVVGEIEEVQQRDAVRFSIEVLLDKWEEHVYTTKKQLIDQQLETISESLVVNAIKKSAIEVEHENRIVSLLVRNALAIGLYDIGKDPERINRKLYNMFSEYGFPEYDFKKGTKIKEKQYQKRKALDAYLSNRAKRLNLPFGDRGAMRRKPRRVRKEKNKTNKNDYSKIEEREGDNGNNKNDMKTNDIDEEKEFEDNTEDKVEEKSPIFIAPESSDNEEENTKFVDEEIKKIQYISVNNEIVKRSNTRSMVLAKWHKKDRRMLEKIRTENVTWNEMLDVYDAKREEKEEAKRRRKEEREAETVDLNALYAESSDEDDEEVDPRDEFNGFLRIEKKLPAIQKIVEDALANPEAPVTIVPHEVKRRERIERPDSAIDSDKENHNHSNDDDDLTPPQTPIQQEEEPTQLPVQPDEKPPSPLSRNDTGFSSTMTIEDDWGRYKTHAKETLKGNTFEDEHDLDVIVEMIPKLDRDQYLKDWLLNGVQKGGISTLRLPTPPDRAKERVRRQFHLKRPGTAESIDSVRDVVPIEVKALSKFNDQGRLNSASSTRSRGFSNGRPISSKSIYSERSSVYSDDNDNEQSEESEQCESEEEEIKNMKHRGYRRYVRKNNKIRFYKTKSKPSELSEIRQKIEKEHETSAWSFYSKKRRELRMLQAKVEEQGRPKLLEDFVLPEKDLNLKERKHIYSNYTHIELNRMLNESKEEDYEILKIFPRKDNSNESDSEEEINGEKSKNPSVEPPATPWLRIKGRPLTPNSADSDEELNKLKDKFYEDYKIKQNGSKKTPHRLWTQYLRKKSTPSLPPPPKLGWQPTPGLINWKNANLDFRKERRTKKQNEEIEINLKRNLFNQLQITVKREENQKSPRNIRLLQRRRTVHNEDISLTKKEKRKKILPDKADTKSVSMRSDRSLPSYARATKAAKSRQSEIRDKLPQINAMNNETIAKNNPNLTNKRNSLKKAGTSVLLKPATRKTSLPAKHLVK